MLDLVEALATVPLHTGLPKGSLFHINVTLGSVLPVIFRKTMR